MSADDPTHLVEGEAAVAQCCEGSGALVRAEAEASILCPICAWDFGPAPPRSDRQFVIPEHAGLSAPDAPVGTETRLCSHDLPEGVGCIVCDTDGSAESTMTPSELAQAQQAAIIPALTARARDLSLAITNPATLARKLRESLIDLVGPEQSRAYHIGASYDSEKGEVAFQIATVTPHLLAQLQISGQEATLAAAYTNTVNGWEVVVGTQVGFAAGRDPVSARSGVMLPGRAFDRSDYGAQASFSVTVRR